MCGIVGIIGREPVAGHLVEALKRLDTGATTPPGVATLDHGTLGRRRRAEGKLAALEKRLAKEPLAGNIGIGHTRWATHGKPTESNAHPHATGGVAVVHNGIIENFANCANGSPSKASNSPATPTPRWPSTWSPPR